MLKKYLLIFSIFLLLLACKDNDYNNVKVTDFNADILSEDEFIQWLNYIVEEYKRKGEVNSLIGYLSEISHTTDLYNDYLNFFISDLYNSIDEKKLSLYYLVKIEEKNYGMLYQGQKLGYLIALRIINNNSPFALKEKMYKLLLNEYKEIIDVPYTLNEFAKLYKSQTDMEKAVKIMEKIVEMSNKNKNIEEIVNLSEINDDIKFFYANKNWIYKDLEKLIDNIKDAVIKKDVALLYYYSSKNGFKIVMSKNEDCKNWGFYDLGIEYRFSDSIIFSDKLEEFSSDKEAFLKTSNWDFPRMSTWYFYFKKIDYPYDEKINGGWEWKGIYFGDYF